MSSADFLAEQAFARTFLNTLGRQPVAYSDDYQQPAESSLKRVPVLAVSTKILSILIADSDGVYDGTGDCN